jgi:uncharacterized membrane protein YoaK (UPF0700 family)
MSQVYGSLPDEHAVLLLAFLGGYYDTAGYLKLQGIFTSSITGNLVAACSSVTHPHDTLTRSLVVVSFTLAGGVGAATILRLKLVNEWNTRLVTIVILILELLLMIAVWILGLIYDHIITNADTLDEAWQFTLVACLMGAAMGLQNIAAKESIANCPPTTVMTSTLINVSSHFSNMMGYYFASKNLISLTASRAKHVPITTEEANQRDKDIEDKYLEFRNKFLVTSKPLLSFIAGALIGSVITHYASFWFSALSAFLICLLISFIIKKEYSVRQSSTTSIKSATVDVVFPASEKADDGQGVELKSAI